MDQTGKRKMSLTMCWAGKRGKNFRKKKQRQSFQTGGKKNNNVSDLGNKKCKCANEMCFTVFITGLQTRN